MLSAGCSCEVTSSMLRWRAVPRIAANDVGDEPFIAHSSGSGHLTIGHDFDDPGTRPSRESKFSVPARAPSEPGEKLGRRSNGHDSCVVTSLPWSRRCFVKSQCGRGSVRSATLSSCRFPRGRSGKWDLDERTSGRHLAWRYDDRGLDAVDPRRVPRDTWLAPDTRTSTATLGTGSCGVPDAAGDAC